MAQQQERTGFVLKLLVEKSLCSFVGPRPNLQFGMLIGQDTWKPENQFLQLLNTEELIFSLKHVINCCLCIVQNTLNEAISKKNLSLVYKFGDAAFTATMVYALPGLIEKLLNFLF